MKYENKRNGQLFELMGEVDPKYNTVLLRNVETCKEQNVTTSTLKRWYKKVEEPVAEPVPEEPETVKLIITDKDAMVDCSPSPICEEMPVVFAEPECIPDMELEVADAEHYRLAAEAYLTALGYEWKRDKQGRTIVRQGGKTCAELYFGKKALKLNVRKDRAEEIEALVGPNVTYYFKVINNYYLPVTIGNIPYTNTAVMADVFGA